MVMKLWECPKCEYRTEQPRFVAEVSHVCTDQRDRVLKLVVLSKS
jgi:hypothetical protein